MKTIRQLLLLISFCLSSMLWSQSYSLDWLAHTGGIGHERYAQMCIDPAGNIITMGEFGNTVDFDPGPYLYTLQASGSEDMFIQKLDPAGNLIWAVKIGNAGQMVRGIGVNSDKYGNIFVSGFFDGTIDFDPDTSASHIVSSNNIAADAFLLKLDKDGNFKMLHHNPGEGAIGYQTFISDNGNIYNFGIYNDRVEFVTPSITYHISSSGQGTYLQKLDSNGNFIWLKGIQSANLGHVEMDENDNMIISGNFKGTVDFDPNSGVNTLRSFNNASDVYLLKLDSSANFQWVKQIRNDANLTFGIAPAKIDLGPNDEILMIGTFEGTIDFDPDSGIQFFTSSLYDDIFIEKFDANGSMIWTKVLGMASRDRGQDIISDPNGNIFLLSSFTDSIDVDPGPNINYFTTQNWNTSDLLIEQLDAQGNFVWAMQLVGLPNYTEAFKIERDSSGSLYILGEFLGTADLDPGPNNSAHLSLGSTDIFLEKLIGNQTTDLADLSEASQRSRLYPNPSSGLLKLQNQNGEWNSMHVYDLQGRLIRTEENLDERNLEFQLHLLPAGTYMMRLEGTNKALVQKIVLEQ